MIKIENFKLFFRENETISEIYFSFTIIGRKCDLISRARSFPGLSEGSLCDNQVVAPPLLMRSTQKAAFY
jgi:hypothetical protein